MATRDSRDKPKNAQRANYLLDFVANRIDQLAIQMDVDLVIAKWNVTFDFLGELPRNNNEIRICRVLRSSKYK